MSTGLAHELGLIEKLNLLRQAINRLHLPLQDKRHTELVSAGLLLRGETNMSRGYRKTLRNIKDSTIKIAPAYHTRRQDGVYYPTIETFNKAYNIIQLSSLPSKTKETSFQNYKQNNLDKQQSLQIRIQRKSGV